MKPISIREFSYSEDKQKEIWQPLGELLVEFNESEAYEENETKLYKKGTKYTLVAANGCSCWDGDWEGWTNVGKRELRKLADSWSKDWGKAEQAIAKWIKENI